ncbi:NADH-ubiquinone oxidoreductase chain [Trifolium medium]|uniref:NADH-ubiquinone oxidoreductase chain n=1 Tax=Trifolium medium TaxID=97028 RepID=A0A392QNS6_9FABA|nr:NADH-ubiquinone oxidoreductase chain [Trifolium medium]
MAASSSSSAVQNPLNPLNLPPIVKVGKSLQVTGNMMPFDKDALKLCFDKAVDFESLRVNGFDVEELFNKQGWNRYFEMLNGPIFAGLIKEFWMKASVFDKNYAELEEEPCLIKDPSLKGKTREQMGLRPFNGTGLVWTSLSRKGILPSC